MKRKIIGGLWKVLKLSFGDFSRVKITKLSAALAYYTIFSLPAMLLVIVTIVNVVYGEDAIQGTIQGQISSIVGTDAAAQIQQQIRNVAISGHTTMAVVVGVIALIFSATKMFGEMQNSLNIIWNLRAKPKRGWVKLLLDRAISFSMVIVIGFLLLISLTLDGVVVFISRYLSAYFPEITLILIKLINIFLSFLTPALLFAILFKVLPDAKIRWRNVIVGALFTTALFMLGKWGIGFYLTRFNVGSAYGAAGSIIVILLWIYYSAIILYFGAAFTMRYAQHFGSDIFPAPDAVWVKDREVESDISLHELERLSEKEKEKNKK